MRDGQPNKRLERTGRQPGYDAGAGDRRPLNRSLGESTKAKTLTMGLLQTIPRSVLLKVALSLLLVFVLYDFTVCTGITFDRPYTPMDLRRLHGEGDIRFVPLESFSIPTLRTR